MRSFRWKRGVRIALQTRVAQCEVTIDPSYRTCYTSVSCNPLHVGLCKSSGNLHPLRGRSSMIVRSTRSVVCACLVALLFGAMPATAQITTGTILGNVKDSTGGVVPGATVVLVSESRGTKSVPAVTNATGDYVFPNVTADVYTVEVTDGRLPHREAGRHQGQRRRPRHRSGTDARTGRRRGDGQRHLRGTAHPGVVWRALLRRSRPLRSRTCRSTAGHFTSFIALTPGVRRRRSARTARASAARARTTS